MSIHCEITGPSDAPPLVLLPPLGGSGELCEPFRADLSRDHRVFTCEVEHPTGIVSTRELAANVAATLRENRALRVDLFGISFGGMVAQWLAIDHGALLRRLVLASTSSHRPGLADMISSEAARLVGAVVLPGEADRRLVHEIVSDERLAKPGERSRIDRAVRRHPHSREELLRLLAAAAAHDTRAELANIGCPTLVLTGARDEILPADLQEELTTSIRSALPAYIEDAGHDITLDQPEETARLVREFLESPARSARGTGLIPSRLVKSTP